MTQDVINIDWDRERERYEPHPAADWDREQREQDEAAEAELRRDDPYWY